MSGLTVQRGTLLLEGKPCQHLLGVNYFDAFLRHLHEEKNRSFEEGFAELGKRKIPFARLNGGGFWPVDWKLWQTDSKEYFVRLDRVFAAAQRHHVGLIPSLCWNLSTFPDLVGEPCGQWGNPKSATHALMRRYVQAVVGRYKNHPTVWGWEFGNEYNLPADLPNAAEHRPQVTVENGTPATRGPHDELTHAQIRAAIAAFGAEVRKLDKTRAIFSGNSIPRVSAWHQQRERTWATDTPEQFQTMLQADNPAPLETLTLHVYEPADWERLPLAAAAADAVKKPLFVGEFGVPGKRTPENEKRFTEQLAALRRHSVPLAALWVYDFPNQAEWSVTAANERAWMLDAISGR
jgi:Cellulase (glycosyl hydrolase family 5)